MEKEIKIATKMYQCRDAAQSLFQKDYQEKITPYTFYIKAVMKSNKISELEAVLRIAKKPEIENDGMAQMMFFAAAVELIEPHPKITTNIWMMETEANKFTQALNEGNIHYCENCKKKQPIELTKYDPDSEDEPDLIVCLVCKEAIGFIQNL